MNIVLHVSHVEIVLARGIGVENGFLEIMVPFRIEKDTSPTVAKDLPFLQCHSIALMIERAVRQRVART